MQPEFPKEELDRTTASIVRIKLSEYLKYRESLHNLPPDLGDRTQTFIDNFVKFVETGSDVQS